MNAESILLIEQRTIESGPVEIWTLNRPQVLNALNSDLLKAIDRAGRELEARLQKDLMSCRAVILTGSGEKAFVAGADIAEMNHFTREQAETFSRLGQQAFSRLESLPIPAIAAINGFALGGGLEIAMCCDVLVATPASEFGQPEAYLGLIPGFGATARFADRLGVAKAIELLCSGRRIKAEEALRLGLIQKITDGNEQALDAALATAREMTIKSGPLAIARIKRLVRMRTKALFENVMDHEARLFGETFESADSREGKSAFIEKRKAVFRGL